MATRNSSQPEQTAPKLNGAERAAWLGGYCAALAALGHRKARPQFLGHLCTEHAYVALAEYRRFVKGQPR